MAAAIPTSHALVSPPCSYGDTVGGGFLECGATRRVAPTESGSLSPRVTDPPHGRGHPNVACTPSPPCSYGDTVGGGFLECGATRRVAPTESGSLSPRVTDRPHGRGHPNVACTRPSALLLRRYGRRWLSRVRCHSASGTHGEWVTLAESDGPSAWPRPSQRRMHSSSPPCSYGDTVGGGFLECGATRRVAPTGTDIGELSFQGRGVTVNLGGPPSEHRPSEIRWRVPIVETLRDATERMALCED